MSSSQPSHAPAPKQRNPMHGALLSGWNYNSNGKHRNGKRKRKRMTERNTSHEKHSHLHSIVQNKKAEVKEGDSRKAHNKTPAMTPSSPNDNAYLAETIYALLSDKNKGSVYHCQLPSRLHNCLHNHLTNPQANPRQDHPPNPAACRSPGHLISRPTNPQHNQ